MVRASVNIVGDVIGVGFRSFVKLHAKRLGLSGWVKNVRFPKRAVEAVIEGEKEQVEELVDVCKKGPEVSWVKKVEVKWLKPTAEYTEFSVY